MPPRQKTARPTATKLVPAQEKLSKAVDTAAGLRKTLRDTVCVSPKYPGAPSDYRYLPHRCVRKGDSAAAASPKKPKASISEADTRKEIKILQKAIEGYGKGFNDFQIDGNNITVMIVMFRLMMRTSLRKEYPDPIKRYDECFDRVSKKAYDVDKSEVYVPRYTVLNLVMTALQSAL